MNSSQHCQTWHPDNPTTYSWTDHTWGSNSIRINNTVNSIDYLLIIAEWGISCAFEITASTSSSSQIITNGGSILTTLTGDDDINDEGVTYSISVSQSSCFLSVSSSLIDPNDDSTYGYSTTITSASQTIDIVKGSDEFRLSEESNMNGNIYEWLIGVSPAEDSGIEVFNAFDFTFMAKTDNPFVTLQDGIAIDASIDKKKKKYICILSILCILMWYTRSNDLMQTRWSLNKYTKNITRPNTIIINQHCEIKCYIYSFYIKIEFKIYFIFIKKHLQHTFINAIDDMA